MRGGQASPTRPVRRGWGGRRLDRDLARPAVPPTRVSTVAERVGNAFTQGIGDGCSHGYPLRLGSCPKVSLCRHSFLAELPSARLLWSVRVGRNDEAAGLR